MRTFMVSFGKRTASNQARIWEGSQFGGAVEFSGKDVFAAAVIERHQSSFRRLPESTPPDARHPAPASEECAFGTCWWTCANRGSIFGGLKRPRLSCALRRLPESLLVRGS